MASNDWCCPPILTGAVDDDAAAELSQVFKALGDPVRVKLVNIIAKADEACACDFPEALGKSQPTISHHLSILVKAGILEREQRGKWAWFWVNRTRLESICAVLGPIT